MATTTSLLSWKEFEQLPDDGMHREILAGELIILPPPKSKHSKVATRLFRLLLKLMDAGLGDVYAEAGYKLSNDPPTWIEPDISFVRAARVASTEGDAYFEGSPELAVEVVSPSESAPDLERKIEALLAGGSLAVWVIYPKTSHVRVYSPDGTSILLTMGQMLTLPEILPGFELPVSAIFMD